MRKGKVKWFDLKRGYGFITDAEGEGDVFFHHSVIDMPGYKSILGDEFVEYEVQQVPNKSPAATYVKALK